MQQLTKNSATRITKDKRNARLRVSKMMAELMHGPSSIEELIAVSGLCESTVRAWMHDLCSVGFLRISNWQKGRNRKPIYSLNPDGEPNVKYKKMSPAERTAAYRKRHSVQRLNRATLAIAAPATPSGRKVAPTPLPDPKNASKAPKRKPQAHRAMA